MSTPAAFATDAIKPPSKERLGRLGSQLGLELTDEELTGYEELLTGYVGLYKKLEKYPEPSLPVKYPRTPGYRPGPEENKYNAWYWKTEIQGASDGKLHGKTVAMKDNIAVAGVPMMIGSRLMEGYIPEFDATVVTRVLDAGGFVSGKASCEDLNLGSKSFSNALGCTLNPHDVSRSAGGSSSGSAALVASEEVDMAIGADQGGSIRVPASNCGIVGMKPTYGLVPYTGSFPIELCVDHLGPMARTVHDCALLLEVIAGYDNGLDVRQPGYDFPVPEYSKQLTGDLTGIRVGLVKEGFEFCGPDVSDLVLEVSQRLTSLGACVEHINIPIHKDDKHYAVEVKPSGKRLTCSVYDMMSERDGMFKFIRLLIYGRCFCVPANYTGAYENMIRSCGFPVGLKGFYSSSMISHMGAALKTARVNEVQPTVKAAMLFGEYMRQDYDNRHYAKTANLQQILTQAYDDALKKCDVLVMPTCPDTATKFPQQDLPVNKWIEHSVSNMVNTMPLDYTGHPSISVNAGFAHGLPVGLMVNGRRFDDVTVLRVAHGVELVRDPQKKY